MKTNERILRINSVLQDYFIKHPQSGMVSRDTDEFPDTWPAWHSQIPHTR